MRAVKRLRLTFVVLLAAAGTTTAIAQSGGDPSIGRIGPGTKSSPAAAS